MQQIQHEIELRERSCFVCNIAPLPTQLLTHPCAQLHHLSPRAVSKTYSATACTSSSEFLKAGISIGMVHSPLQFVWFNLNETTDTYLKQH